VQQDDAADLARIGARGGQQAELPALPACADGERRRGQEHDLKDASPPTSTIRHDELQLARPVARPARAW
jgi:hypothetical protein